MKIKKNITVMVFGAFDGIHNGHIYYLKEAKKLGQRLIAVIARDHSTWKFKRKYNLPEQERLELIKALGITDDVILGSTVNAMDKIEKINPDILAITPYEPVDKDLLQKEIRQKGLRGLVVQLKCYKPEIYDSLFKSESMPKDIMNLPLCMDKENAEKYKNKPAPVANELPFERILQRELENIQQGMSLLLETSPENLPKINIAVTKILAKKSCVIIVSATRQYSYLIEAYQKNEIPNEKIWIIDFMKGITRSSANQEKNHLSIRDPSDLTSLFISLHDIIKKPGTTILIDSLSTLMIYNKPDILLRFIQSLFTKVKENKNEIVLISLEENINPEVRAEVLQLCDKVIKIGGQIA